MRTLVFLPSLSAGPRRRALLCALLTLLARADAPAAMRASRDGSRASTPYLRVAPPPPLRFAAALKKTSAPITAWHPPLLGPPPLTGLARELAIRAETAALALTTPPPSLAPSASPSASPNPAPTAGENIAATLPPPALDLLADPLSPSPPPPSPAGVFILPDDTPRDIRPEDVLVYFRHTATPSADPAPPASSATYQQK